MQLKYFARYREMLGCGEEQMELPTGVTTVSELLAWLQQSQPERFDQVFAAGSVLTAVNEEMAKADTPLSDNDTVALFPPVTGG